MKEISRTDYTAKDGSRWNIFKIGNHVVIMWAVGRFEKGGWDIPYTPTKKQAIEFIERIK